MLCCTLFKQAIEDEGGNPDEIIVTPESVPKKANAAAKRAAKGTFCTQQQPNGTGVCAAVKPHMLIGAVVLTAWTTCTITHEHSAAGIVYIVYPHLRVICSVNRFMCALWIFVLLL